MAGPGDSSSSKSTAPPLLAAHGLIRRGPNAEPLLDGVNFTLNAGERWAIHGASGTGKTLFLRALAMLDPLSGGEVRWRGEAVSDVRVPEFRRQVAYLPQRPSLLDGSVADNLAQPYTFAAHRGQCYEPARIAQWLVALDREPSFLQKAARDLSGGEAQLAALLRSLQFDPQVLLLDEPTAALDSATASAVERLLRNWMEEARSADSARGYIWISHDSDQLPRIADRFATMAAGRIESSP